MNERDMESLLWRHPDRLLGEELKGVGRQSREGRGRTDLVFRDTGGRTVIVEVKKGVLSRSAITQIAEYGALRSQRSPQEQLRLVLIANIIPEERRLTCASIAVEAPDGARLKIECREIPESPFRQLAEEVGYRLSDGPSASLRRAPTSGGALSHRKRRPRKRLTSPTIQTMPGAQRRPPPLPRLPEEAWFGVSTLYRQALVQSTEASDNYHFAGFLVAVGAALGKSVYLHGPGRMFPNFYTVLVGESSYTAKSTAIHKAEELSKAISPNLEWLYDLASAEGLIAAIHRRVDEHGIEHVPSVILETNYVEPFVDGRIKGGNRVIALLRRLHDSSAPLESNTLHQPIGMKDPPAFCVFGEANRLEWLKGLRWASVRYGIADCITFILGDPKGPIPNPTDDKVRWDEAVYRIRQSVQFWQDRKLSELNLSREATETFAKFRILINDVPHTEGLAKFLTRGLPEQVLKAGIVFAALERSSVIEATHIRPAIAFGEFLLECLPHLFSLTYFRGPRPDSY